MHRRFMKELSLAGIAGAVLMCMSLAAPTAQAASEPQLNTKAAKKDAKAKDKQVAQVEAPRQKIDYVTVANAEDLKNAHIVRIYDKEAGVLCYRFKYPQAMSCVPLSQTLLRPSDFPQ